MPELNAKTDTSVVSRCVSGRYRGAVRNGGFEIDLRIDVDGRAPCHRISADMFNVSTDPVTYGGSLVVAGPRRTEYADGIMLAGRGSFTSTTATPWVEVWIPHVGPETTPRATLSRFGRDRQPGPVYDCELQSPHFRRIELTEDRQEGVEEAFEAYEPAPGKRFTIASAFEMAGIEVHTTSRAVIKTTAAGADAIWSDAELHAAMVNRLGTPTVPEWAVWLLHAGMHERDRGSDGSRMTLGLMFDGIRRNGCAIFYRWLSGTSVDRRREQLYACVHEIGHTLNLHHCWRETLLGPARPDAMTWMNNPRGWPKGADAFWRAFAFAFDVQELAHLRHGFLADVRMGTSGYAPPPLERDPWPRAIDEAQRAIDEADTGLRLRVFAPRELQYGLPMTVGLQLWATRSEPQPVPATLGPRANTVDVIIRGPDRSEFVFQPLLEHCRGDTPILLRAGDPPVRDYAFVHYGKNGFAFPKPGRYELRARCVTPTGTVVLSKPTLTEVRPPLSRADHDAQAWLYGDEQGILMSLTGSSAATLAKGDDKLQEFIDRQPNHPAADVARLVRGTNAGREFKTIEPDGNLKVIPRDASAARTLFGDVFDTDSLSRIVAAADDESAATRAMNVTLARTGIKRNISAGVDAFIKSRRHEIKAQLFQVCRS
jgi:hypothetical protein